MTTQEIIDNMRMHIKMAMPAAANRLEQLWKERDEARAELETRKEALLDAVEQIEGMRTLRDTWYEKAKMHVKERDEARAEIERLKEALSKAIVEIGRLQNVTPAIRPEPSRLEIAAMCMANEWCDTVQTALRCTDELIAAAREAK